MWVDDSHKKRPMNVMVVSEVVFNSEQIISKKKLNLNCAMIVEPSISRRAPKNVVPIWSKGDDKHNL